MNYNVNTRERIADIERGLRVQTGDLEAATYIAQAASAGLFNVYGAIKVLSLYGEVTEVFSSELAVVKYRFQSTDPVIAVADMSANSGSLADLAVGYRITLKGDAVGSATLLTASPGVSYYPAYTMVIGTDGGTGHIETATTTADLTDGNVTFFLFYLPMSNGAYVTAAV